MKKVSKIKLPDKPGVYLFKKNNQILYVGKATSLKNRVQSYMSKRLFDMRGPIVEKMIKEADKVDWEITDSVLEALILEAELIKKYKPYYNTKEKDDKSFNYVVITNEEYPRVITMRGKELLSQHGERRKIYGPFPHGSELREALKIIRRIFPY